MENQYFCEDSTGNIYTTLYSPEERYAFDLGWVYCHPLFYEFCTTYFLTTVICKSIAEEGFLVIRPDLNGYGNSEGNLTNASIELYKANLHHSICTLREMGIKKIGFIGSRLGANIATWYCEDKKDFIPLILCDPIVDFSRYIKELKNRKKVISLFHQNGSKMNVNYRNPEWDRNGIWDIMGDPFPIHFYDEIKTKMKNMSFPEHAYFNFCTKQTQLPQNYKNIWKLNLRPYWLRLERENKSKHTRLVDTIVDQCRTIETTNSIKIKRKKTASNSSIKELSLAVGSAKAPIRTILHRPRTKTCLGGVVILPGEPDLAFGQHQMYTKIARELADNQIAVMRFDYREKGNSIDVPEGSVIDDIVAVILELKKETGGGKTALIGMCLGAEIASAFALTAFMSIDALILWSPNPFQDDVASQYKRTFSLFKNALKYPSGVLQASREYSAREVIERILPSLQKSTDRQDRGNDTSETGTNGQNRMAVHKEENLPSSVLAIYASGDAELSISSRCYTQLFDTYKIPFEKRKIEGVDHSFRSIEAEHTLINSSVRWLTEHWANKDMLI